MPKGKVEKPRSAPRDYRRLELQELELSIRASEALKAAGLERVEDAVRSTRAELLAIPRFGRKGLNELLDVLQSIGLEIAEDPHDRLRQRLQMIREEWEARSQQAGGLSPYERPSGYLKREIYQLARNLTQSATSSGVMPLLDEVRGRPARGKGAVSLLHGLMSMVVTDQQLQRTEKNRYADELQYALRHKVPDEYLIGFLLQIGSSQKTSADWSDNSRFEVWFDPARAACIERCVAGSLAV